MKVAILYNKFFDHDGREQLIGGVETYISNLAKLCREMEMETTIYQWSNQPFEKSVNGLNVKGVPVCHLPYKKRKPAFFRAVAVEIDADKDILIFGADHVSVPTKNPRHISIQHGISWDLPVQYMTSRKIAKYEWAAKIKKLRSIRSNKQNFENCQNTVCVDYNFLNWYRTIVTKEPEWHHIWVIPNSAQAASDDQVKSRNYANKDIRILFARRFVQMRGTRLIAEATKYLLGKYNDISFTFAGEGPDENWLRGQFATEERVQFTKYMPDEVLDIHLEHDVAVVPSLASEGTSLSVAEAMATGCPVVATATGGITNMIIDRYNGILVMPNAQSLREGIESLIENPELRRRIGVRAYETARDAFSLVQWKKSWQSVLAEVAHGK
jgi:glycosyltransferase involved in cell wall biosynthesis